MVQVGRPTAELVNPEPEIAKADIVVGKARAILDAMACGRAAYIYDMFGTDGWVTPELYPLQEADGFAGLALPIMADEQKLRGDLDDYHPLIGQANRELILMHHVAGRTCRSWWRFSADWHQGRRPKPPPTKSWLD